MTGKIRLTIIVIIAGLSVTAWGDRSVLEDIVEQVEVDKNAPAEVPVEPQFQPAQVVIIGTIHSGHYKNPNYSPEKLKEIILSLKPDVILNELPLSQVEPDGRPLKRLRRKDFPNGPECWAADTVAQQLGIKQIPFDRPDRQENFRKTKYFERQREANKLRKKFGECLLKDEADSLNVKIAQLQGYAVRAEGTLRRNAGPDVINSEARDSIIRIKNSLWYEIIPEIAKKYPECKGLLESGHFFRDQWDIRNQIMADNITNAAKEYPGKRLVVITGATHRYILRDLLKDNPHVELKEYWEIVGVPEKAGKRILSGTPAEIIHQAVRSGIIVWSLTESYEIKYLLGEPQKEEEKDLGETIALCMSYPNIEIWFRREKEDRDGPFKLHVIFINGKEVDCGGVLQRQRQIIVRNIQDFRKAELKNVDLRNLDLSGEGDYLKDKDFDSLTQWPSSDKLPRGFDPKKLLEEGKNPGLGIRALHEEGITGKGVGIAIMDQPLLLGHEEYTSRLIRYDASRASWLQPQMHGARAIGIAVGKTCGVAPGASVFYYAGRTSAVHEDQADWISEIIKYNATAKGNGFMDAKRIRVISISEQPENAENNEAFLKAYKKAKEAGILVVTVADKGGLTLIEGKDPDRPESYKGGGSSDELLVPTRNKTLASHRGVNTYIYSRGLAESWTAPYIAGLAALAFQVNPDLRPAAILEQLAKTATRTKAGLVVNPRGFIEAIKKTSESSASRKIKERK